MSIPDWWQAILLVAAAFRVYRLLAQDTILDGPRSRLLRYHGWQEGTPLPDGFRIKWGEFLTCPWCSGFWISLSWWGAWQLWPHATVVVAVPLAVSAAVGLVAQLDTSE